MSAATDAGQEQGNSVYAALAHTTTRAIALYFSRPVRLFRPSKVSGWHSLKGHALQSGVSLTPQYLSGLVRKQGFIVIPKHFIPPMIVNAILGTILWTTYSKTSSVLEPHLGSHHILMTAISGAVAGGMQAVVAAPAENVRLVLEGGSGHAYPWSHAWKEVFQGTTPGPHPSRQQSLQEIRQIRRWLKDVGYMAGRGWDGWGWGIAKDTCGFATFFAIFEITRNVSSRVKVAFFPSIDDIVTEEGRHRRHFSRIIHGLTLVTGGVIAGLFYEITSRPWDVARRAVQIDKLTGARSAPLAVIHKLRVDGLRAFFRDPVVAPYDRDSSSPSRRRMFAVLRTLARVGPWGVGFLVWQSFGSGLS